MVGKTVDLHGRDEQLALLRRVLAELVEDLHPQDIMLLRQAGLDDKNEQTLIRNDLLGHHHQNDLVHLAHVALLAVPLQQSRERDQIWFQLAIKHLAKQEVCFVKMVAFHKPVKERIVGNQIRVGPSIGFHHLKNSQSLVNFACFGETLDERSVDNSVERDFLGLHLFNESQGLVETIILDARVNQAAVGNVIDLNLLFLHLLEDGERLIQRVHFPVSLDEDAVSHRRRLDLLALHLLEERETLWDLVEFHAGVDQTVVKDLVSLELACFLDLLEQLDSLQ